MKVHNDESSAEFADHCVIQFPENNKFVTNVKFLSAQLFGNLLILQCIYSLTDYADELFSQLEIFLTLYLNGKQSSRGEMRIL